MRRWIVGIAAGALCAAGAAAWNVSAKERPLGVADLGWLAGNWVSESGEMAWDEHWTAPRGDAIYAVSRMVEKGVTKLCELTVIENTQTGPVYRIRHFSRSLEPWKMDENGPMTMKLVEQAEQKIVFEDEFRDFPRRISYERKGDALTARLEGQRGGKPAVEKFEFKLAK